MRGGRWQHLSSEAHAPRRFLSEIGEDTRAALQGSPCVTVTPCRCVSDDISLERRKFCRKSHFAISRNSFLKN